MLGYVLDDLFGQHRAPSGHPERPARVEAIRDALRGAHLAERATHVPIRAATDEELARAHDGAYLDELVAAVPGNTGWLDPDTYFSPGTWDAARAAAGSAAELATAVLTGRFAQGLAVVRPPGHHATRSRAMGFCLLNNVAIAATAARAAGAARVAIVDWDVHHGNGTQDIFWDDPSVLYMSVHQYPYYPGTGAASEIGGPNARGATVNVGLPGGSGNAEYAAVFDRVFLPALARFKPDLILVSAGFDAYEHDPLAGMRVTHAGFRAMAQRLRDAANRLCGGRIVALLEGGYDLDGLAGGMVATLEAFLEAPPEAAAAQRTSVAWAQREGSAVRSSTALLHDLADAAIAATLAAHGGLA